MDCGDEALNGKVPTAANFDGLALGPCVFYPIAGYENNAEAAYTMVQRSGLRTKNSAVLVTIVNNEPPTINDPEDEISAGDDFEFDLSSFHDDFENEPVDCVADSLSMDPGVPGITATLDADCVLVWNDDGSDGFEGTITLTYRACDTHPTLQDVPRAAGYHQHISDPAQDDLSSSSTRRCSVGNVVLTRKPDSPDVSPPFQAVNDYDVLDRAYSGDGIGPFHLDIDVAANDASFNSATNVTVDLILPNAGYVPSQAGITNDNERIQVSSTNVNRASPGAQRDAGPPGRSKKPYGVAGQVGVARW